MDQVKNIYRKQDIEKIEKKISYLGLDVKEKKNKLYAYIVKDATTYLNVRILTSILIFFIILYNAGTFGYFIAPTLTVLYYYLFYVITLDRPIKKRIKKLDHEALNFFEILTLTLESGRNLEHALKVATENVTSEISLEFEKTLFEVQFGKSLMEALEDMKERIPSETVNNILLNITQTNVFGNNILETMYDQIDFLRDKQILEIKGEMNKIPLKISIVSVIFIVPLILLLVLGPFIISFL
jgi:Flp pilus assembly protein TadB